MRQGSAAVGVRPLQVAERPSRLGLPAVFPGCRIQFERPERHVVFVFDRNTVPGGCAAVGTGERDRGIILRIGRGHRTVHDSRGMPVRGYGFDAEGDARLVTAGMVDAVHARQFDGADRDCLGERDLDPHGFAVAARRQVHRAAVRTGEHLLPRQVAVPFGREGLQEIAGIVQRRGKGQHSNVAVIAPCLPPRLRKGQHHAPVPCRGIRAAPGQMAHRIRRFDPRPPEVAHPEQFCIVKRSPSRCASFAACFTTSSHIGLSAVIWGFDARATGRRTARGTAARPKSPLRQSPRGLR